jgi:hypothetical protein
MYRKRNGSRKFNQAACQAGKDSVYMKKKKAKSLKKKKPKSIGKLKKEAWRLFSIYIRKKHMDRFGFCRCYTCDGVYPWNEIQAGHGIGGRTNSVLFDEEIVKPQCVSCNIFRLGNYTIFTTKLIKQHGMEWWERKLFNSRLVIKYTRSDIQEIINKYS